MARIALLVILTACTADRSAPSGEPHTSPALKSDAGIGCYAPGGADENDSGTPTRVEAAPVGDPRCAVLDGGIR